MAPKIEQLINVLSQLLTILEGDGDTHWSSWIQMARARLERSHYSGIEKLLSAYGGMGSFNDYCLKTITRENCSFSSLQKEAWNLATDIKRENESYT